MMLKWLELDFETASAADLKKVGASRYAEDVTTEIICASFSLMGEEPKLIPLGGKGLNADLLRVYVNDPAVTFVAHGCGFEKAIWRCIMVAIFGWPDIPNSRWHDSMAVCAMKALPLDLDTTSSVLRLPQQKDKGGKAIIRALSKPKKDGSLDRSPELLEKCYGYNKQDIRAQVELHTRIGWLPPGERQVWLLDQRINERGVRLDLAYVRQCQAIVDRTTTPLAAEFRELTGGLEFTQTAKLGKWCAGQGLNIPNMQKETLARLLGEESEDDNEGFGNPLDTGLSDEMPGPVRRALTIRSLVGSAAIKKLRRMDLCVGSDGRARGLLQYHGATPGRWSGRLLQPQNFPRGTLKDDSGEAPSPERVVAAIMSGDTSALGPPIETVVSGLRHSIIADPGRLLVSGDFAKIEAIIVLALAGERDQAELLATGADPYIDFAKDVFDDQTLTKKTHPKERQVGKEGVLGSGFQMGWQKAQAQIFKKTGIMLDEARAKKLILTYRQVFAPGVPKVWYALEEAALETVITREPHEAYGVRYQLEDSWMTARLPSGRKLWYYNPQLIRKRMPWNETIVREAWTYQAMKTGRWKTIDAYGGHETENVVQALARDLLVAAMFRCEKNGFPVILTVHDEIVAEPEVANADEKALDQIMREGTDWSRAMGIPIATETWKGDRYKK